MEERIKLGFTTFAAITDAVRTLEAIHTYFDQLIAATTSEEMREAYIAQKLHWLSLVNISVSYLTSPMVAHYMEEHAALTTDAETSAPTGDVKTTPSA